MNSESVLMTVLSGTMVLLPMYSGISLRKRTSSWLLPLALYLNVETLVSLNPIMVDGTGMCGGCRVTIGNETKFACVDGPEFDGHKVDYDELMLRLRAYQENEQKCHSVHCNG